MDVATPPSQDLQVAVDPAGAKFLRYVRTADVAALDELLAEHLDRAYQQARRFLGRSSEAEDAVQNAYVRLVHSAHRYDGGVPFGAWLGRLVHLACLDIIRANARRRRRERNSTGGRDLGISPREVDASDGDAIRAAVSELPETFRATVDLHYFGGLSQSDTAKVLGLKENTVAVRLHRARECLRALLERRGVTVAGGLIATALVSAPTYAATESCRTISAASILSSSRTLTFSAWVGANAAALVWTAAVITAVLGGIWYQARSASSAPATPFARVWNFNTKELPSDLSFTMAEYRFLPDGGPDGSGCLQKWSLSGIAQIQIPSNGIPLPLVVTWKMRWHPIDLQQLHGRTVMNWFGVGDCAGVLEQIWSTPDETRIGEWTSYSALITERSISLWHGDRRLSGRPWRFDPESPGVLLLLSDQHSLDDLAIRSATAEEAAKGQDVPDPLIQP